MLQNLVIDIFIVDNNYLTCVKRLTLQENSKDCYQTRSSPLKTTHTPKAVIFHKYSDTCAYRKRAFYLKNLVLQCSHSQSYLCQEVDIKLPGQAQTQTRLHHYEDCKNLYNTKTFEQAKSIPSQQFVVTSTSKRLD